MSLRVPIENREKERGPDESGLHFVRNDTSYQVASAPRNDSFAATVCARPKAGRSPFLEEKCVVWLLVVLDLLDRI